MLIALSAATRSSLLHIVSSYGFRGDPREWRQYTRSSSSVSSFFLVVPLFTLTLSSVLVVSLTLFSSVSSIFSTRSWFSADSTLRSHVG